MAATLTGKLLSLFLVLFLVMCSRTSSSSRALDGEAMMHMDAVPDAVNWVDKGAFNPIQNQGQYGCCWSFAATAALEAVYKIKNRVLLKLSEQQLLDCASPSSSLLECGGQSRNAYEYVVRNGGISLAQHYPYRGRRELCRQGTPRAAKFNGYKMLPPNDEVSLLKAVAEQPVTAGINGTCQQFQDYRGGIFKGEGCGDEASHEVVIVGYGTSTDGTKYWILRNSWGPNWGERGYMRIARQVPGRPRGVGGLATVIGYPYI